VNRRRILVALLGVGMIVVAVLLFPSLHRPGETPTQQVEQPQLTPQPRPAESVSTTPTPPAALPVIPPVITVAKAAPAPAQGTISVDGVNDIDPAKAFGSKNAPVVMEIYSDFQCPACKTLFTTTTQKIMDNYVNSGKVYLIPRDFPLPMHAHSRVAASYSRAAAHIGKCDEVEQALFRNQEKWDMTGDVVGTVAAALSPAEMKKVQALVDAKTLEPLIEKDKQLGQMVPVNQTPYSVLHTKSGQTFPVVGFVSYDVLKSFLDQLVAQK
jgi:protein-disulfide isomerase